ncbi:MAG TPA: porin [Armatimonadota bacterium]|nr:porin [Armatimonadota bacterium]
MHGFTKYTFTIFLSVILTVPSCAQPVSWFIKGYVQARYTDEIGQTLPENPADDLQATPGTFELKRAYLYTHAQIDKHVGAALLVRGVPDIRLREAYGEYTNGKFATRLGLAGFVFGYEVPLSSSNLITLDGAKVTDELFPFTFDRGIYADYAVGNATLSLGVTNGTPPDVATDPDSRKNIVGRLGYATGGVQAGASIYNGTPYIADPVDAERDIHRQMDRYGVDVETYFGPWATISEVILGKDDATGTGSITSCGGYMTLAYRKANTAPQPYLRFDTFDPNTHTSGDYFQRWTAGMNYYLNPKAKVTLEYQYLRNGLEPNLHGQVATQYQVIF